MSGWGGRVVEAFVIEWIDICSPFNAFTASCRTYYRNRYSLDMPSSSWRASDAAVYMSKLIGTHNESPTRLSRIMC